MKKVITANVRSATGCYIFSLSVSQLGEGGYPSPVTGPTWGGGCLEGIGEEGPQPARTGITSPPSQDRGTHLYPTLLQLDHKCRFQEKGGPTKGRSTLHSQPMRSLQTASWFTLSIRAPFFCAYEPHNMKTTPLRFLFSQVMTASVNCSQPEIQEEIDEKATKHQYPP